MATSKNIVTHQDLDVYRKAIDAAMQIFEFSKKFPKEERYSLTDHHPEVWVTGKRNR